MEPIGQFGLFPKRGFNTVLCCEHKTSLKVKLPLNCISILFKSFIWRSVAFVTPMQQYYFSWYLVFVCVFYLNSQCQNCGGKCTSTCEKKSLMLYLFHWSSQITMWSGRQVSYKILFFSAMSYKILFFQAMSYKSYFFRMDVRFFSGNGL